MSAHNVAAQARARADRRALRAAGERRCGGEAPPARRPRGGAARRDLLPHADHRSSGLGAARLGQAPWHGPRRPWRTPAAWRPDFSRAVCREKPLDGPARARRAPRLWRSSRGRAANSLERARRERPPSPSGTTIPGVAPQPRGCPRRRRPPPEDRVPSPRAPRVTSPRAPTASRRRRRRQAGGASPRPQPEQPHVRATEPPELFPQRTVAGHEQDGVALGARVEDGVDRARGALAIRSSWPSIEHHEGPLGVSSSVARPDGAPPAATDTPATRSRSCTASNFAAACGEQRARQLVPARAAEEQTVTPTPRPTARRSAAPHGRPRTARPLRRRR